MKYTLGMPKKKLTPKQYYIHLEQGKLINQYVFDKMEVLTKEMKVKFGEGTYAAATELFTVYFAHNAIVSYINYYGLDPLNKKVQAKALKLGLQSIKKAIQPGFANDAWWANECRRDTNNFEIEVDKQ